MTSPAVQSEWIPGSPTRDGWWLLRTEASGWPWITLVKRETSPDDRPIYYLGNGGGYLGELHLPGVVTHYASPHQFAILWARLVEDWAAVRR